MDTINAIIIDDEKDSRDIIKIYLEEYFPSIKVIIEAESVTTGIKALTENSIELLFLDIQLKNNLSFEILNKLDNHPFEIIFITAHDEYAIQAIKHHALDYLLKPIERSEFKSSVNRFLEKRKEDKPSNIKNLLSFIESNKKSKQLRLPTLNGFEVVNIEDIAYLESDSNYTNIHFKDGKKTLVSKSMKEYEAILPKTVFCRIHNSHIVNTEFVKSYIKGRGGQVILNNNKVLNVSNNKKNILLSFWK